MKGAPSVLFLLGYARGMARDILNTEAASPPLGKFPQFPQIQ